MRQLQQGDVLLMQVDSLPVGGISAALSPRNGRYILADGESTGHAHAVPAIAGVLLFQFQKDMFLKTDVEIQITHEEHQPVMVDPGIWRVGRVVEVDPFENEIRQIMD